MMPPEDQALLDLARKGGDWLRAFLCTLARRGLGFRQLHPERARALLDALSTYPPYKGGQFLFDLMEWEDYMLDGPPPEILPAALDGAALSRLARFFNGVRDHLEGSGNGVPMNATVLTEPMGNLPPMEGGIYLYEDVVLGILESMRQTGSKISVGSL